MIKTSDLKVTFLGITPVLEDKTGILTPQEIVALSALMTFKGKSVQQLLKETADKGQDLNEKIKKILRKSSLKGHASMATTPALAFSYEASKFLDSAMTGMVFASSLMASGRRTDTTADDIVYPSGILKNAKAREIYQKASEKNIDFSNLLLQQKVNKDEASKILHYGIYGTGIVQFPIESIISLNREYETEKKWMPEEIGFLLKIIEKELKNAGLDLLYATRSAAPRNTYPYPHIFKNPNQKNLVRELFGKKAKKDNFAIVSSDFNATPELKKQLNVLKQDIKKAVANKKELKEKWPEFILRRQQIAREYNLAANIKILSQVAWRVWGDKKRHRTVPMAVESVYYCIDRAEKCFKKHAKGIKEQKLIANALNELDSVFSIPPTIRQRKEFLYGYLERALDSLSVYSKMKARGVAERDAVFIIPRGLKIDVLQDYNFYNLIAGYYPLRICSTAEEELRRLTIKETIAIKKLLEQKNLGWLADHIVPKCHVVGFCLEEKICSMIKSLVPDYTDEFHEEMKNDLEEKFANNLKTLEA